jgi:hypothetical protein
VNAVYRSAERIEAPPFKGRVWVGMVLMSDATTTASTTIPTAALPLKGRETSRPACHPPSGAR